MCYNEITEDYILLLHRSIWNEKLTTYRARKID